MTETTLVDALQWSEDYVLNNPVMDETHQEFVQLLNGVLQAPEAAVLQQWEALVDHTQEHFDREDRWMLATGFTRDNCHASQHAVILKIMREGTQRGRQGDLHVPRQMARELTVWFPQHAQAMDASLAIHLESVGYDMNTGEITRPQALPVASIEGCGGTSCSDSSAA